MGMATGVRRTRTLFIALLAIALAGSSASMKGPHYYPDDPIAREPEPLDASGAQAWKIGLLFDLSYNTFVTSKYKPTGTRARNINTIDEVPDSSWFTNRVGTLALTPEEVLAGPSPGRPPAPERWTIIREKSAGANPGFTARDANGETWFLSFDGHDHPEGDTAAIITATKLFWGLGYNQVDTFLTTFDPKNVEIDPQATAKRPNGSRTPFTRHDMQEILERTQQERRWHVPRRGWTSADRKSRGRVPLRRNAARRSERHRSSRAPARTASASRVRCVDNLTDLKAGNTIDAVVTENGHAVVKHYLQDVGSTFGTANGTYEWDLGWEHFYEGGPTKRRLFSFGFALSPWQTVPYEEYKSIGRFEGDRFDPTGMEAADTDDCLHGAARRRRVLGGAAGRRVYGIADPRRGAGRALDRSQRRATSGRRDHETARQDRHCLSAGGESDRESRTRCRRNADVRERRRVGGRRAGTRWLSRRVVPLRQCDGCDVADWRDERHQRQSCRARLPA